MLNGDELRALLARVEAATGPDQELGCDLTVALFYEGPPTDARHLALGRALVDHPWLLMQMGAENITISVDAASALVERMLPSADLEIGVNAVKDGRRTGTAFIRLDDADLGECWSAATPALAIIAALLKALIAQGDDHAR